MDLMTDIKFSCSIFSLVVLCKKGDSLEFCATRAQSDCIYQIIQRHKMSQSFQKFQEVFSCMTVFRKGFLQGFVFIVSKKWRRRYASSPEKESESVCLNHQDTRIQLKKMRVVVSQAVFKCLTQCQKRRRCQLDEQFCLVLRYMRKAS